MQLTIRLTSERFEGPVEIGDGVALPNAFTALIEDDRNHEVEIDVVVEDGAAVVDAVRFKRNPQRGPITARDLHFPLGAWLTHALDAATMPAGDEPGSWLPFARVTDAPLPGQRRRNTLTPALLREVADVYLAAVESGDFPAKAVEERWNLTPRTASRWIQLADADLHFRSDR